MHRKFMLNGWLLLVGYLVAWLPFAMVERVAFLYHYIPPLLLTFLGAGLAFDLLTVRLARVRFHPLRLRRGPFAPPAAAAAAAAAADCAAGACAPVPAPPSLSLRSLLCALLLVLFAVSSRYFAPLYFGFPMQPDEQSVRVKRLDNWLDGRGLGGLFNFMRAV